MNGRQFLCSLCLVTIIPDPGHADEWQWRRIAWEDRAVWSVLPHPDSSSVLYASIAQFETPDAEAGVYKSMDGGISWEFLSESNNPFADELTFHPNNTQTVYCGSAAQLYFPEDSTFYPSRTRNAGANWERIWEPLNRIIASPWRDGFMLATGWEWGGLQLRRSINNGADWTELYDQEVGMFYADNIIFHREDSLMVYAYSAPPLTVQSGLARSNDHGYTWEIILEGHICSFDHDPENSSHWIAVKTDGYNDDSYFAESFDNGDEWELTILPYGIWGATQITFDRIDPRIIYLVDVRNTSVEGILKSEDVGQSWSDMNQGFPDPEGSYGVYQCPDGRLYATRRDGLWLWSDQQSSIGQGHVISDVLQIRSLSPNPFSGIIHAEIFSNKSGYARGYIYSLEGSIIRQVFRRTISKGSYRISWDGRDSRGHPSSPGTYVLRIEMENLRQNERIIRLK